MGYMLEAYQQPHRDAKKECKISLQEPLCKIGECPFRMQDPTQKDLLDLRGECFDNLRRAAVLKQRKCNSPTQHRTPNCISRPSLNVQRSTASARTAHLYSFAIEFCGRILSRDRLGRKRAVLSCLKAVRVPTEGPSAQQRP
ncbi:hypothetical protein BV22DRAFT_458521 [Leucogyrophana mollusca]|uniref:Uncharacterized protein n=1 Tax=Leucogyrophana mollusca TaxID=85980 RepID=A0ACB8BIF1_9AGAM|nr:hypothetical protein BV22DRAFT_458521 [Leucogyrophana mollusca]